MEYWVEKRIMNSTLPGPAIVIKVLAVDLNLKNQTGPKIQY